MMISKLRVLGVAVLGLFLCGLAYGQGAIVVNSGADFWNRLVPENSVYVDDAGLASPQELNDLGAWLRGQNHHWEIIFLNRLNADSFVNQVSAGVNSDQNFLSLHDNATGEPDASLVVIGKSPQWQPNDPHFSIRVYAAPYLTRRGAGANGEFFNNTVLPEMKRLCNQVSPIAAAKYAVQTLPNGAVGQAAPMHGGQVYAGMGAMPSSPMSNGFEQAISFFFLFRIFGFVFLMLFFAARRRHVWYDDGSGYYDTTVVITNDSGGGWDMGGSSGGDSGGGGADSGGSWGGGDS